MSQISALAAIATVAVLICNLQFSFSHQSPPVSSSLEKSTQFRIQTEDGIPYTRYYEATRVKRGAAYPGGHGDFSGVAKQSTFAALGSYGGHVGHGSKGNTAGGYGAGSGSNGLNAAGGITIAGALGSYGGNLGHHGPTVISSGGFGNGGLLFGKI